MFEKDAKMKPEDTETIIGAGVKVEGTFVAAGDVVVKGQIIGSVETESDLILKQGGLIEADIKAQNISVAGVVKGNLEVLNKIEMASTANVAGDINCQILSMEEGATLSGRCSVGKGPSNSGHKREKAEEI